MRRWAYIDGGEWRTTAEESIDPYMCNEYPKPGELLMPASYTDADVERVAEALWRNNFPNDNPSALPHNLVRHIEPTKDDLRVLARVVLTAYLEDKT